MTADEFYDLVKQMREKQKEYLRTRDAFIKLQARCLEKKVDYEISYNDLFGHET